jgi:hypothetical protein
MNWLKFKLVDNWTESWRWISMRMIALALIWESIPEEAKDAAFTDQNQGRITVALIIAAGLGRMKDQGTAK